MRIIDCEQGSEEWESWRARPTASCFDKFIKPSKGGYSKQATKYACEIVAKRMLLFSVETVPSLWMDYGTENEPNAAHAYEKQFGVKLHKAGFVLPDHTDAFGGSPDRLVGLEGSHEAGWTAEGVVEFKCVKAETLMAKHLNPDSGELYAKPQVQGLLLITQAKWCDFYVWHPELEPFHLRVEPDIEYQTKIAAALVHFLREIQRVEKSIRRMKHEIVAESTTKEDMNWGKGQ